MSGMFGIVSRSDCMEDLFYGTDYHSHLGTEFGGIAAFGDELHNAIHRLARGQFKELFSGFSSRHSARGGVGVISGGGPQPIVLTSHFGALAIATTGMIANRNELAKELMDKGVTFTEGSDPEVNETELTAKLIAQKKDIVSGIENVFERIEGSLCIILHDGETMYAARDKHGRFPLCLGEKDSSWAVTSETCAFPNLGFTPRKHLLPGEILRIQQSGPAPAGPFEGEKKICSFLWIYTGYPASVYEGVSVESVRERCGAALARKDTVTADLASGVPDSGTGHAVGYGIQSGLPFRRPLVKYSAGYGRSYTPRSQEVRDQVAKMKLIPIEDVIEGNRLIVCEDSIVRGTQLKNLTIQKLWDSGAAEVHIRVACPPLMFPCRYSLSTRTIDELAARRAIRALEGEAISDVSEYVDDSTEKHRRMVAWVRDEINATSLIYLSLDEMQEAIGLPRCDLCTYCWAGEAGD